MFCSVHKKCTGTWPDHSCTRQLRIKHGKETVDLLPELQVGYNGFEYSIMQVFTCYFAALNIIHSQVIRCLRLNKWRTPFPASQLIELAIPFSFDRTTTASGWFGTDKWMLKLAYVNGVCNFILFCANRVLSFRLLRNWQIILTVSVDITIWILTMISACHRVNSRIQFKNLGTLGGSQPKKNRVALTLNARSKNRLQPGISALS